MEASTFKNTGCILAHDGFHFFMKGLHFVKSVGEGIGRESEQPDKRSSQTPIIIKFLAPSTISRVRVSFAIVLLLIHDLWGLTPMNRCGQDKSVAILRIFVP
jgi:hypothetical protein